MTDALLSHAPAGQPFKSSALNRIQVSRMVTSRVPITGGNFIAGRSCSFAFNSSPTDAILLSESRLVMRLEVTDNDSGALKGSTRFQFDPINSAFSSASHQINSVTVDSCGSNLVDLSNIQHRLHSNHVGASTTGSEGMLSFKKHMCNKFLERSESALVATNAAILNGQGADASANKFSENLQSASLKGLKKANYYEENEKQSILTRNGTSEIELAAPIALPFWRSNTAIGGPLNHVLELTIANNYTDRMFFSEKIEREPSHNGVTLTGLLAHANQTLSATGTGATSTAGDFVIADGGATVHRRALTVPLCTGEIAAVTNVSAGAGAGLKVEVVDMYLSLCYVTPRAAAIQRPLSFQLPYTGINLLTRSMTNGDNHTEMFQIPLATQLIAVAIRLKDLNKISVDGESYTGGTSVRTLQIQRGGESQPTPQWTLDPTKYQVARAYQSFNQIVGGSNSSGKGQSLVEWVDQPIFLFRTMSNEMSTSLTVRMTTDGGMTASNFELMIFCMSQAVVEVRLDETGVVQSVIKDSVAGV